MVENKIQSYKSHSLLPKYLSVKIPNDWSIVPIRNLITEHKSGIFKNQEYYGRGTNIVGVSDLYYHSSIDGQLFRLAELSEDEIKEYRLKKDDIVYSESSLVEDGIGRALYVTGRGENTIFAWHTRRIRLNDHVYSKYVYYALESRPIRKSIISRSTTTALTGITTNEFFNTKIPIPPLQEQHKISSILSKLDELIQKTALIIKLTQILKKGLMQRLLTKGIGHTKFKNTALGEIPEEWNLVRMKEIVESYKNGIYKKSSFYGRGIPNVRMFNIQDGKVNIHDSPLIEVSDNELLDYGLRPGDILLNRVNSADLVGKAGIIKDDIGAAVFDSMIIRIRINNLSLPLFLNYFLNSRIYFRQIEGKIKHAVGQSSLNQDDLNNLLIGLPTVSEQKEIVSSLSRLDEKSRLIVAVRENVKNLKNGLMQQLLSGKIRVTE